MAVTKLKAYHSDTALQNTMNYIIDKEKTRLSPCLDMKEDTLLSILMNYAENPWKTTTFAEDGETEVLVSGHHCKVDLAKDVFQRCADTYYRNGHSEHAGKRYRVKTLLRAKLDEQGHPLLDATGAMIHDEASPIYHDANGDTISFLQERTTKARTCYMWVLSFPPKYVCGYDIDPHLIHQISKEFMEELEKAMGLQFAAVLATHLDKAHPHTHIVQSSYALDGHHKYVDTMETLKKSRELSDRLSQKYQLPILLSPNHTKSMSKEEWKLVQQGKSWKQAMREDIAMQLERASTYEDFLEKMAQYGYTLRETEHHFTYYTPKKDHRCRDVGLGKDYTKSSILEYFQEVPLEQTIPKEKRKTTQPTFSQPTTPSIYVSRYTNSGRRRTELELLLLKAIQLLQLLQQTFSNNKNVTVTSSPSTEWKIARLSETIQLLHAYEINTKTELKKQLHRVGAEYSHLKKKVQEEKQHQEGLEQLKELLEQFQELQEHMKDLGITDAYLAPVTAKEIATNRAALFPMTASQRRELYLALQKNPLYRMHKKYQELTYHEANDCICFLKGHTTSIPEPLTTVDEWKQNLEKKYTSMAEKMVQKKKEQLQGKELPTSLKNILESLDLGIEVSSLSFFEGIHLAAYYKSWKPSFSPCKNPKLCVSKAKANQLSELLQYLGKEINLPVHQLSHYDASIIMQDLLLSMITPDSILHTLDSEFEHSLAELDYETRGYAHEWRKACQTITALGYDIAKTAELLQAVESQLKYILGEEKKLNETAKEYRTLKQLQTYVTLSEDTQFLYGSRNLTITPKVTVLEIENPVSDITTIIENKKHPIQKTRKQKDKKKETNIDF